MKSSQSLAIIGVCSIGFLVVISGATLYSSRQTSSAADAPPAKTPVAAEVASLRADVERLKQVVPDQAHAMSDVDYHFTNLWFAGKAENWPLADFYWKETLSHLRWAVRIIPVRKDSRGQDVRLTSILEAIENTPQLKLGDVIKERNPAKFEPTYRAMVEACYTCHKAADKPYLRPRIPERPASHMMNFDPRADWPK